MPAHPIDTPPTLKHAARGYYYCRWAGRLHTFGSDAAAAREQFLDPESAHPGSLRAWQAWYSLRCDRAPVAASRACPLLVDLAEDFFATYDDEQRPKTSAYFRGHLRRFLHSLGAMPASAIDLGALEAFRRDLLAVTREDDSRRRLAPKTIAHDLKAVKTFWRWAASMHPRHCRALELSRLKPPPLPEPTPHPITPEAVRSMIDRGAAAHPELRSWLSLSYLALLRPSEVLRIAAGLGRFEPVYTPQTAGEPPAVAEHGLYVIASKVGHRTGAPRRVVLSDQALLHLRHVQSLSVIQAGPRRGQLGPRWTRLDNFGSAVSAACGFPPSVLRDSAASHLVSLGVEWGVVDQLLGHMPSGAGRSYIRPAWHVLRAAAGRLAL